MPAKPAKPKIPARLWMLWSDDIRVNAAKGGVTRIGWVIDGDGYCCFTSLSEAKHVAGRYLEEYDISCRPVRVKGGRDAR